MLNLLRTTASLVGLAAILALCIGAPASAEQSSRCGYWSQGQWVATRCAPRRQHAAVSGTIVGVSNNMLAVQTSPAQTVVVNDEPALRRMSTGRIYTGRVITAYGYWEAGQFVATSIS